MELHHVLLMIAVIVGLIVLVWNLEHHLAAIEAWLAGMGHWAGLGFVLLFVVHANGVGPCARSFWMGSRFILPDRTTLFQAFLRVPYGAYAIARNRPTTVFS